MITKRNDKGDGCDDSFVGDVFIYYYLGSLRMKNQFGCGQGTTELVVEHKDLRI
jgi:hypothetical protein